MCRLIVKIFNGDNMRKLVSIFIFSATLLFGMLCVPVDTPTLYEKIYSSFSQAEANSLLGRRVRNKFYSERFVGMKYPLYTKNTKEKMFGEKVRVGETGQVIGLYERGDGFGLRIKWDEQNKDGEDMFSIDNRFSSRVFLEFE